MRRDPATLAVLLAFLLAVPVRGEQALTVAEYRQALAELESELRTEQWRPARARAEGLLTAHVQVGETTLATDAWVLEPVLEIEDAAQARSAAGGLAVLRSALAAAEGDAASQTAPDPQRLARLAAAQQLAGPQAGGEVRFLELEPPGFWQRSLDWLAETGEWILEKLEKLLDWLRRGSREQRGEGTAIDTRWVVVFVGLAALLLVWLALRRRRSVGAAAEVERGEPIVSRAAGDADPLSREEDEWQRYARELEAQGRLREAIRAWYHAVLVALYRQGLLQYRKGRTNWEHVAMLSPGLLWRANFIALTRAFESEWYGRAASSAEALARVAAEARSVLGGLGEEREAA